MDHLCPICQRKLSSEHMIEYDDYHCYPSMADHHYSKRLKGGELIAIKARLSFERRENRLFFKIYFTEGYSEIWSRVNSNRIKINHVFMPDFTDIDKLQKKLRTYLLFS